mgnify:CR=1 FL=1
MDDFCDKNKEDENALTADALFSALNCENTALTTVPDSDGKTVWKLFANPDKILRARKIEEVEPLLLELENLTSRGFCAAGFISYEAANAFESKLPAKNLDGFPLAQFAVFKREPVSVRLPDYRDCVLSEKCVPEIGKNEYFPQFADIKRNIIDGNIYQANLTFRASFKEQVPPEKLFLSLYNRHPVPYAAYLNFGEYKIVSLSPELFLESDGANIKSSPMKGTAKRLPESCADSAKAKWLSLDEKNRAENLMVTDMVRNDFSRICIAGSVTVNPIFHVDTYKTVHQMISTVHGKLSDNVSLFGILQATFPPASITGTPKISAVNIISRNEKSPRKIYTGCIGCFLPDKKFRLNVAIRTLLFENGAIETGIGGGVVFDSNPESEWREALLKCDYATFEEPDFDIFETLLWTRKYSFSSEREHMERALSSIAYFGYPHKKDSVVSEFETLRQKLLCENGLDKACVKIFFLRDGSIKLECTPPRLPDWKKTRLRIAVCASATNSEDAFLYHKTTNRKFYDSRLREARENGFHEVLFLNEKGEVTEGSISNIFIQKGGNWLTPPIRCGLLPGIWRAKAVRELKAEERILRMEDIFSAEKILMGNSLRGSGIVGEILAKENRETRIF